ncbi:hypothetical protein B0H13DRAFT_2301485 [Mycena leptocephala]|nr:hypothetical protein B0H13DRAFT_2301485 [Mycena leptocephala]
MLYRIVLLSNSRKAQVKLWTEGFPPFTFPFLRHAIAHRPHEFLNRAVTHLLLDAGVDWSAGEVDAILPSCVTDLFANVSLAWWPRALVTFHRLRRLAIDVGVLLSLFETPSFLDTVTHLELLNTRHFFKYTGNPKLLRLSACISYIPHLTHIAFNSAPPNNWFPVALCANRRTRCIACLRPHSFARKPVQALLDDKRFVCIDQKGLWREDWLRSAYGGADYWARADFIAAKQAGNVDGALYLHVL